MSKNVKAEPKIIMIPIYMISSSKHKSRHKYIRFDLYELTKSIEKNGIIQPLIVRYVAKYYYELIAGERRIQAAVLAGLRRVPCVVLHCTEQQSYVYSLVENIQRKSMDTLERSEALRILIEDYKMTKDQAARQLGISRIKVDEYLELKNLDQSIQRVLINNSVSIDTLVKLSKLDKITQLCIANDINENDIDNLNDFYLSEIIDKYTRTTPTVKGSVKDIRLLYNTIENAVAAISHSGVNVTYRRTDTDDYVDYNIHIAKAK